MNRTDVKKLMNQIATMPLTSSADEKAARTLLNQLFNETNEQSSEYWTGKREKKGFLSSGRQLKVATQTLANRLNCKLRYIEGRGGFVKVDPSKDWFANKEPQPED
jgi:hypothetical protein